MKYPKKLCIDDCVFLVGEKVYEPAEDTFLLAENLEAEENGNVLDLGTGCGILAVLAAKQARKVVATDINPYAIKCAKENARKNCVEDRIEFRLGDLFQPIRSDETFSLILFNAPYLPSKPFEQKSWIGRAWAGGANGRDLVDRFIMNAAEFLSAGGRILLVQSSLSGIEKTLQKFADKRLRVKVVAEVKFPFERIVLIEAEPTSSDVSFLQ
jgi:release factor glutamine methyltransferase